MNLNTDQLPPDCQATSTSLSLEMGRRVSRMKLLKQFILSWDKHYQHFIKTGHAYVRNQWIEHNVTLGRNVTIKQDAIQGVAVDISEKGGLIVSLPDGSRKEFLAEDVTLGRTYYQRHT